MASNNSDLPSMIDEIMGALEGVKKKMKTDANSTNSVSDSMRSLFPQLRTRTTNQQLQQTPPNIATCITRAQSSSRTPVAQQLPTASRSATRRFNPDFIKDTWTRDFCCLPYKNSSKTPTMEVMRQLDNANLGKKRIVFNKKDTHSVVIKNLCDAYPRLKDTGGFTLFRAMTGGYGRDISQINTNWFDVKTLKKKNLTGTGIIYIRPLQRNLNLSRVLNTEINQSSTSRDSNGPFVTCLLCSENVRQRCYTEHVLSCSGTDTTSSPNLCLPGVSSSSDDENLDDSNFPKCDICLQAILPFSGRGVPLECECIFHRRCIKEWLAVRYDGIHHIGCPSCGKMISGLKNESLSVLPISSVPIPGIRPSQSRPQIPDIQQSQSEPQIPDIQPSQSEPQIPDIQPSQSEPQIPDIRPSQSEPQIPDIRPSQSEPQIPDIQPSQSEPQIRDIRPSHSEPQIPDIQPSQSETQIPDIQSIVLPDWPPEEEHITEKELSEQNLNLFERLEPIQERFLDTIGIEKQDRCMLTIRRRCIWKDSVLKINKLSETDLLKPLYIDFIGEDGDDFGGLTREFFSLCFVAAEGEILQGSPGKLCPIRNNRKKMNQEFEAFGKMIALAVLHGCPGPCNLSTAVSQKILGIEEIKVPIDEVSDFELQEKLKKVEETNGPELKAAMMNIEERFDAGIPLLGDITKHEFINLITYYRVITLNEKELEDISSGLELGGILKLFKKYTSDSMTYLMDSNKLTAVAFKDLCKVEYSDHQKVKELQEDIFFNFCSFLEDLEKQPGQINFYDPFSEKMILKKLTIEDILQYITGSRKITSFLRREKVLIRFTESLVTDSSQIGVGFESNTCELSFKFPMDSRFIEPEEFKAVFIKFVINSPGFGKA